MARACLEGFPASRIHAVSRFARLGGRVAVLCGLLSLAACAGAPSTPLSKETKASVRAISINPAVTMPAGSVWRCAPDPCAGIPLRELTKDLGEVLRADLEAQLTKASNVPSVVTRGGDAELVLTLLMIRLDLATGMCGILTHCHTPVMTVEGALRTRDGALLWQRTEEIDLLTRGVPKRALATYQQQPALLRQDFAVAAHIAAERLVRDMQK